jgi:chloramphenicol-sensitive protein RarD
VLLTLAGRWRLVAHCFRLPALRWTLSASTILIALNWYAYIYGVITNQIMETSLGYFINPLVNVLLGMVFFRERLRSLQWLAIALAFAGVAGMTIIVGGPPWIALSLAGCFGLYGLLRKKAPVDGLVGLSVEIFLLAPLAGGFLLVQASSTGTGLGQFGTLCDVVILSSGVVTALPLMCFAQAARRLQLTTMGFLQFMSPTLQFFCALALGEALNWNQLASFACIWAGLAVFSADAVLARRGRFVAENEDVPFIEAGASPRK